MKWEEWEEEGVEFEGVEFEVEEEAPRDSYKRADHKTHNSGRKR